MSKEFQPYNQDENRGEFNAWEYKKIEETAPVISKEEAFLNECERLRQEAIEKGYAEGLQKAQTEIAEQKQELVQWVELLQKPVQFMDDKLTQEIIQTVIWLSQHCISVELSVNPEKLHQLLNQIKEELPSLQGNKVFAMHPDDVSWINDEIGEQLIPGLHNILVGDPSLSRGDFYLKSEHSELDGRIQTRFITLFSKYIDKDNLITPIENQE